MDLAADLKNKADLSKVEERLRSNTSITTLVNNAGFGGTTSLVDSKIDELEKMIELNVTALTAELCCPAGISRERQRSAHQHLFDCRVGSGYAERLLQRDEGVSVEPNAVAA